VVEQRLTTLSDYVGVLRRRLWILVLAIVVAVGAAYLVSSRETPAYRAEAQVQIGANALVNIFQPTTHISSTIIENQVASAAQSAHTTPVAQLTLRAAKVTGLTPDDLLNETSITPSTTSTFVTFSVTDRYADRAKLLATTYARQYTAWSNNNAVSGVQRQIAKYTAKVKADKKAVQQAIQQSGSQAGGAAEQQILRQDESELQNLENQQQGLANNNKLAQPATSASKVRPATTRNLVMGLGLGVVIGLVLVSLAEALDTRIRHSDEVAQRLGLPLLTRIPIPPRSLRKAGSLGMLADQGGVQTEAYRKLRINLDFANLSIRARTIMVTSALEQEGKSTTVANLAVALARAGRRVVLVDLDLRKPYIDHFFDLTGRPGLTDVALGNVTLDQAMWSIPLPGADAVQGAGSLHVLPSGPMPPNPADLIESAVVSEILLDLAERADVVLLDSAPLLPVADGVVLSNKVDAMLVVVRGATTRRPVIAELQRVLAACPAAKLGFVLTGAEEGEGYGYGYGYAGYAPAAPVQAARATPAVPYEPTGNGADVPGRSQSPTNLP
jgi:capsular exopolysaccharide synthesis family protein